MNMHDTDRLWISDMRVQKLIIDTLNGKTPLASNKELTRALKALADALGVEIKSIADALGALSDTVAELYGLDIGDRLDALEEIDAGDRLDALEEIDAGTRLTALEGIDAGTRLTSLETFENTTVPNTYCTLSLYNALEARVYALEHPTT